VTAAKQTLETKEEEEKLREVCVKFINKLALYSLAEKVCGYDWL